MTASVAPASALVIDLQHGGIGDTLSVPSNQSVLKSPSTFTIDFKFHLDDFSQITDTLFTLTSNNTGLPSGVTFDLYSGSVGSGSLITSGSVTPGGALFPKVTFLSLSSQILNLGDYYFEATGLYNPSPANSKLSVAGSVNISAVPEASTWAMMVLGFAALGFAGYRSRRNADAAI